MNRSMAGEGSSDPSFEERGSGFPCSGGRWWAAGAVRSTGARARGASRFPEATALRVRRHQSRVGCVGGEELRENTNLSGASSDRTRNSRAAAGAWRRLGGVMLKGRTWGSAFPARLSRISLSATANSSLFRAPD